MFSGEDKLLLHFYFAGRSGDKLLLREADKANFGLFGPDIFGKGLKLLVVFLGEVIFEGLQLLAQLSGRYLNELFLVLCVVLPHLCADGVLEYVENLIERII